MAFDKFLIAPIKSGLERDVRPWLIPNEAFSTLQNAYNFRGRIRKRFGTTYMNMGVESDVGQQYTRLRVAIPGPNGTTDGIGGAIGNALGGIYAVGQMFSIGDEFYTVVNPGAGANPMLATDASTTHTFNLAGGAYVFAGAPAATQIYFYPALPVMGILTYQQAAVSNEITIAFDRKFAYVYSGTSWGVLGNPAVDQWTGSDSQFFWGTTYIGNDFFDRYFYVTNYSPIDSIRYWTGAVWAPMTPNITDPAAVAPLLRITLLTSLIIIPFKDRLVVLNTQESERLFPAAAVTRIYTNRARFSAALTSPQNATAWRQDIPGRGGFVDAPTAESIVSAAILKDRLIVYFEASTWELVYTGNQILPFVWQKINSELGCESTFSIVQFDKALLGIGNVGVHACNGINVERIDQKIPDEVFKIQNDNSGIDRVHGIRDFYAEMVYWTFPSDAGEPKFPNRVLVYNYKEATWAFNDDSITAFGYWQPPADLTWATISWTWEEGFMTWDTPSTQSRFRNILAGNQEGFVLIVNPDIGRNAPALQITNILDVVEIQITAINHNLQTGDFIIIENAQGVTNVNDIVFQVELIVDANTFNINLDDLVGVYTGGGTIARISRIDIYTKQYNFYTEQATNSFISKIDFLVDKTTNGEITVDSFLNASNVSLNNEGQLTGAQIGTGVLETSPYGFLYPLEDSQARVWHSMYFQADGECIQLRLYLSDAQLIDTTIAWSDFQLNAMAIYAKPTSRLQ